MYVQVKDDEKSEDIGEDFWENFTCSIRYVSGDRGVVTRTTYTVQPSCGV